MTAATGPELSGITLTRAVEQLGPDVVRILTVPDGQDAAVSHVVLHDPAEPVRVGPGDVLLALGIDPAHGQGKALIEEVAAQQGSAVAVKLRGASPEELVLVADDAGVALLEVTTELTWEQLYTLLRTILASAGQSPDAAGAPAPLGDLFALANAVAAMVGGPATIEDPQSRVLAYSNLDQPIDIPRRQTILGRRVPAEWTRRYQEEGIFRRLWSTDDVVRLPAQSLEGGAEAAERIACAVRAGEEILGSIWVAEGDSPLGAEAEHALRQSADIAALHLVKHRAGEDIQRRMRSELLRSLLEGRGSINAIADRLGLDPVGPYVVVAFEIQATVEAEVTLQRERALQLVSAYCESYRRRASLTAVGPTIFALLPLPESAALEGVGRLVDHVLASSDQVLTTSLLAGVGSVVRHLRDVPRSRQEADEVVRVLSNGWDDRQTATIDQVQTQVVLLKLRDLAEEHPWLRVGKLEALHEADRNGSTAYIETLRAYLDAFGHIPTAARALAVHPNTFRYRLRRLKEISGLDLEDPDDRLITHLQLRLG